MTIPALHLKPVQRKQIATEAEAAYPNECCGIIYGTDTNSGRFVNELEPVANDFPPADRHHRFSISPKTLIAAERKCGPGRVILGFYHSHPDHPATPSEYDRAHAWPFYSYVIVSVPAARAAELSSWMLDESTGQFQPQPLLDI